MSDNSRIPKKRYSPDTRVRICKIGDFLDVLDHLEFCFENYYKSVRDKSSDNSTKLLSYYLGRHYRRFILELNRYGTTRKQKIRERKMQQTISILPCEWLILLNTPPHRITGRNLLETAITYNKKLTAVYRDLLSQKLHGDVIALIQGLDKFERNEADSFEKMLSMNYF